MKKGTLKESVFILSLILALSLTACSNSGGTKKPDAAAGENSGTKAESAVTEETQEYVYIPEVFSLKGVEFVNAACTTGEGIYITVPFYDDVAFTSGERILFLDAAGTLKELPLRFENGETSSVSVNAMGVMGDGSLVCVKREMTITNPDTWEGPIRFFLIRVSAESGEEISSVDITEQLQFKADNGQPLLQFLEVDREDHIYVSDGSRIQVFDIDGNSLFPVATDAGGWIQDMGVTKEGQVVYSGWDSAAGGRCLFVIDEAGGTLTSCKEDVPETTGMHCMEPGAEKGILVHTMQGLVEYDTQTQISRSVLDWADSGVSPDAVVAYTILEDGNILAISRENSAGSEGLPVWQALLLRKMSAHEAIAQKKETLTLGIFDDNSSLLKAVYAFNRSQETYQIDVVNYGEDDDLETGITRFTNELITGTGPDLFDLSKLDLNRLAQMGVLEELTPYLEGDDKLKKDDFFASVLDAYSVDGKLYTIPNSFIVWGMAGRRDHLGDCGEGYSWTLQDVMDLEERNSGKEMFGYGSKDYVLLNCLRYNYSLFIDWQSGECKLDEEAFIRLLEFADRFPAQYSEQGDYSVIDKILDGTLMAEEISLSSLQDYQVWEALFGRDFCIKGFPAVEGTGLAVQGNNLLAVNAKSEYKKAAWEFVRSLLTEEYYQRESVTGFPTRIQAYEQMNEEYTTPEYDVDENGKETERSKGSFGIGDFSVEFRTSTEEEAAWMTDLIQHCDRADSNDEELMKIVQEEAAAFFEGQKTAQETAEVIQSRVKMYVNENR